MRLMASILHIITKLVGQFSRRVESHTHRQFLLDRHLGFLDIPSIGTFLSACDANQKNLDEFAGQGLVGVQIGLGEFRW
jgi:hypothetical protein